MALTDKSAIPLAPTDLRVVQGERCFLDRRLALRLGYDRADFIRRLIQRNEADFEERFGNLRRCDANYPGAGRPTQEYWLTKGQALWVCRKSDAKNADDVMEEIIKVFLAVDAGASIPDTPWTDALFAPERPTIEHEGNIVHVKHEQIDLFQFDNDKLLDNLTAPIPTFRSIWDVQDDADDAIARRQWLDPEARHKREIYTDQEGDWSYRITQEFDIDGDTTAFDFVRMNYYNPNMTGASSSVQMLLPLPIGNGKQVMFRFDHSVALAVIERAYLRLGAGPLSELALATLRRDLAF
jgi:hypothetical protein